VFDVNEDLPANALLSMRPGKIGNIAAYQSGSDRPRRPNLQLIHPLERWVLKNKS
jgi:hypothetical protein